MAATETSQPSRPWLALATTLLFAVLFTLGYLQTQTRWWFEDDTMVYYHVSTIANPLDIFHVKSLTENFGTGHAFVPMQMLSYWLDFKLFGVNPGAAYAHSLLSFFAVVGLLWYVLYKVTRNALLSSAAGVIWIILPSTIATLNFLSTRHYIEGLFFFLCVIALTLRLRENLKLGPALLIGLLALTAMLFKEIYVTTVPVFLFFCAWHYRQKAYGFLAAVLMVGYFFYRLRMVGGGMSYTMPLLGPPDYIKALLKLPFTLTASYLGYLLYGMIIAGSIAVRSAPRAKRTLLLTFLLIGATLMAVFPVMYALGASYKEPGTWYRISFLVNTILVFWGAWIASRLPGRQAAIGALAFGLCLIPGMVMAHEWWSARDTLARAEGEFYLKNPDKLLLSTDDAYWFMPGVHKLYGVPNEHYITAEGMPPARQLELLGQYPTLYDSDGAGGFKEDREVYAGLKSKLLPKKNP